MAQKDKITSPVKIVDGKLILSLLEAKEPVVWQMDLKQAHSSAFTVKEDKEDKTFNLVLKTKGGSSEDIAPFGDKQGATDLLMEISDVLQNAHGEIYNNIEGKAAITTASPREKSDKLGASLAIVLALVLIFIWMMSSSAPSKFAGSDSGAGQSSANYYNSGNGNPRETSGVAVSADEFLSNR
ncbi:MAG: hypothetical protein KAJ40_03075 [Alphaproteobacteria bacterium]|nr:hypothetical protein [Alphaproteobacteria bacterium]